MSFLRLCAVLVKTPRRGDIDSKGCAFKYCGNCVDGRKKLLPGTKNCTRTGMNADVHAEVHGARATFVGSDFCVETPSLNGGWEQREASFL